MRHDTSSIFSLSFIDVLLNSFACLLVLFFIMLTLRSQVMWSPVESTAKSAVNGGNADSAEPVSPFLVLVKIKPQPDRALPWARDRERQPRPFFIQDDDSDNMGVSTSYGADFAVLYAKRPPAPDAKVYLNLAFPHQPGTVTVYVNGRVEHIDFTQDAEYFIVYPRSVFGVK